LVMMPPMPSDKTWGNCESLIPEVRITMGPRKPRSLASGRNPTLVFGAQIEAAKEVPLQTKSFNGFTGARREGFSARISRSRTLSSEDFEAGVGKPTYWWVSVLSM
jgi:hypothetical protein